MDINHLYFGDCFDLLPEIESGSVDLICTDPAYVTALADIYSSWNLKTHDFEVLADQFDRILKPNGQIAIFCDYLTSLAIGNAFQKHFRYLFSWYWIKNGGQFINKKMPRSTVEMILVWAKNKAKTKDLTFNPIMEKGEPYIKKHKAGNKTRKKESDYVTINNGDRWPIQHLMNYPSKDCMPKIERSKIHPAQKSLGLIGYIIRSRSHPGDLVLDNFAGTGTTAITSHRLKRNWICIEKDPAYYKEAKGRIEIETNQLDLI